MYEITKEQATNFWGYCTLTSPLERNFYLCIPKILDPDLRLYLDEEAKDAAERLASVINAIQPPEDGEYNKAVCVMSMARAYVNFLNDVHNNNLFLNPGSFFLICTRISKHVY